jgi:hypothetical protein
MSLKKRNAKILAVAKARLNNMKSVAPNLDLGNGLSTSTFDDIINSYESKENAYNGLIAQVDAARKDVDDEEDVLRDIHERMLAAVLAKYGHNSVEYAKAGGTNKKNVNAPNAQNRIVARMTT